MLYADPIATIGQHIKILMKFNIYSGSIADLCLGTHFERIFRHTDTEWVMANIQRCLLVDAKF